MVDESWINKVNRIKKICAESKLPVAVEVDKTPDGIDGEIILGDLPFTKTGDVYDVDFTIGLQFSTPKKTWSELLARLQILSQKLCRDTNLFFNGWAKLEDESLIIYNGSVIVKGLINPDIFVS